jgi:hypothetical protein
MYCVKSLFLKPRGKSEEIYVTEAGIEIEVMLCPSPPSKKVAYSILVTDESNTTAPVHVELP